MMSKIYGLVCALFSKLVKFNTNEALTTWVKLEMHHKCNLENLEYLKKLRIKNF